MTDVAEQQTDTDEAPTRRELTDPELFINRELSWLDFNDRVLQLAEDEHLPVMERLKFLAIFVTNLDEFFQVRVAGVHDQIDARIDARGPDGLTPGEVLRGIHDTVRAQDARHARAFSQVISPELAEQGVRIVTCAESGAAPETIEEHFREQIFPVLTPLAVGAGRAFVHLRPDAVADRPPARSRLRT
jgi:polyphosphate kinase